MSPDELILKGFEMAIAKAKRLEKERDEEKAGRVAALHKLPLRLTSPY